METLSHSRVLVHVACRGDEGGCVHVWGLASVPPRPLHQAAEVEPGRLLGKLVDRGRERHALHQHLQAVVCLGRKTRDLLGNVHPVHNPTENCEPCTIPLPIGLRIQMCAVC